MIDQSGCDRSCLPPCPCATAAHPCPNPAVADRFFLLSQAIVTGKGPLDNLLQHLEEPGEVSFWCRKRAGMDVGFPIVIVGPSAIWFVTTPSSRISCSSTSTPCTPTPWRKQLVCAPAVARVAAAALSRRLRRLVTASTARLCCP